MEVDVHFDPPAVGETVLYATNPGTGRVAVIHADDFSIETVPVGVDPSPAVAAPGRDLALSIQRAESTVSVLRTDGPLTTVTTLALQHDANAVRFDPSGTYAVLFEEERPGIARRNFHDVSVLDLTEGAERVVRAVVGYGPSQIAFDPAGTRAIVVTQDGICPIDFATLPAGDTLRAPLLPFDTIEPIVDAHVAADGSYAVALIEGLEVQQLDLIDGTVVSADLRSLAAAGGLEVTDLDLTPAGDEAIVVIRSHELLVRLPLGPALAESPGWTVIALPGHSVGSLSISPLGDRAVGYTTDPTIEAITILDFTLGEARRVLLRKSVRALAVSPDAAFALVLHHANELATGPSEDELVDRSHGYSVVDLETGFTRLALLDAEVRPDGVVLDAASERLLLALRDDASGIRELQVVDLATFAVDAVPLLAPPTTLGIFPSLERAFIGQEADGGRVTFYLWNTRETHTVAGFELAARIRR